MKRNPYQMTTNKIYPLIFWQDCDNCKMQFRREYMYRIRQRTIGACSFPVDRTFIFCKGCAPNQEQLLAQFKARLRAE